MIGNLVKVNLSQGDGEEEKGQDMRKYSQSTLYENGFI